MPKPKTARAQTASRTNVAAMRLGVVRQLHVWISVFIAPSLLFFAVTGALQTFRIPDQKTAPVVLQKLARLHKDDVFAVKPPRPKRAEGHEAGGEGGRPHQDGEHDGAGAAKPAHDTSAMAGAGPEKVGPEKVGSETTGSEKAGPGKAGPDKPSGKPPEKPAVTAMKWFSVTVSIGMAVTTLFGLWLALVYSRNKLLIWALLIAGIATPIVIAAL